VSGQHIFATGCKNVLTQAECWPQAVEVERFEMQFPNATKTGRTMLDFGLNQVTMSEMPLGAFLESAAWLGCAGVELRNDLG
jgi:hypothetical protein